tara:strand:- start:8 stop:718 length:711 start_codon:yes stop_codon:yes gene_type:complete
MLRAVVVDGWLLTCLSTVFLPPLLPPTTSPPPLYQGVRVMSYTFDHSNGVLSPELCLALRDYYDRSPRSCHLNAGQEGENTHLPSCRLEISDRRGLKSTNVALRTEIHNAIAPAIQSFFKDSSYRFKRFTVRRYSPKDRDSCNWHIDACDLSLLIFVGGTCVEGGGGDLIMGEGPTPNRVVRRIEQKEGSMVLFEGCKIVHSATPVTLGDRYVVVLFINRYVARTCVKKNRTVGNA